MLDELARIHERLRSVPEPPLLSGKDVMEVTGIEPGPAVGRILGRFRDLQDAGKLRDREEALSYLKREMSISSNEVE